MNHLQAAHLRLLESLPRERIRTRKAIVRDLRKRSGLADASPEEVWKARRSRIAVLVNQRNPVTGRRWTERDMATQIGISRTAVQEHMRALTASGLRRIPLSEGVRGREVSPLACAETAPAVRQVRDSVAELQRAFAAMAKKR